MKRDKKIHVRALIIGLILVLNGVLLIQMPSSISAVCINWAGLTDDDCDGLANTWETVGYDVNGDSIIDLTLPDADPQYADIYLEIDYMQNHKPRTGVIEAVVQAFKDAPVFNPNQQWGIDLHVFVNEQIPHVNSITMWTGFDTRKDSFFGLDATERSNALKMLAKDNTYHYALFLHQYNGGSSSGIAELPGDDFVVSLGAPGWGTWNGHTVGSVDQQKGTLMHEFGHNLGLRHGGNVDENCKAQYLSVMSYSRQFSNYISDRPLDYSRSELNILDENALIEQNGISPASEPPGLRAVWVLNGLPRITQPLTDPANPIDWNGNGIVSGTSSGNINNLGTCSSTMNTYLGGYDDWMNIIYWSTTGGHQNGTIMSSGSGPANSSDGSVENIKAIENGMVGINTIIPINGTVGINTIIPINATDKGDGLMTIIPTEERPGMDELNVENLISTRVSMLESIIDQVNTLPEDDFTNKTSKSALLNNLRIVAENLNSNSTDLPPIINGLTSISNQTNSLVVNPNTQQSLTFQMNNFIEALKKQQ